MAMRTRAAISSLLIVLAFLVVHQSIVLAQQSYIPKYDPIPKSTQSSYEVRVLGHIGGSVSAIAIKGSYAYAGMGSSLAIFKISSPNHPTLIGQTGAWLDTVADVAVAGDYAYVANRTNGLRIVNVSNPSESVEIGHYEPAANSVIQAVVISGTHAMVADHNGMRILDIANPTAPIELGYYSSPAIDITQMKVVGSYVYAVSASSSLRIIDITNGTSPVEVGHFDVTLLNHLDVVGNYVFLASGAAGLQIVNVANPAAPVFVNTCGTGGDISYALDVQVVGTVAYVADSMAIVVLNVATPSACGGIGYYPAQGLAERIAISGKYALVSAQSTGMVRVIDLSDPAHLYQAGAYGTPANVLAIAIAGNYAYLAGGNDGLSIVDIANPTTPRQVSRYQPAGYGSARNITLVGNYAYLADSSGLRIVNISDPNTPIEVGAYTTNTAPEDVIVAGAYAYIADGFNVLRVINISDPTNPVSIGMLNTPGQKYAIALAGSYVYLADGTGGLRVINVTNPATPIAIGAYYTSGDVVDIFVAGNYAYVVDSWYGIRILDVSTPAAPVEVGSLSSTGGSSINVSGSFAYVTYRTGLTGGLILDVSNPAMPVEVTRYLPAVAINATTVKGTTILAAEDSNGLATLGLMHPASGSVPTTGGVLTSYADGITYTFAANTFTNVVTVTHTALPNVYLPPLGYLIGAGHYFEVGANFSNDGKVAQPLQAYTLNIHYTDRDKSPASDQSLALYYWDGTRWLKESTSLVDLVNKVVTARPSHFSTWALAGTATYHVHLPVIVKSYRSVDLAITGLEITQATQDPANSVPLVANRPAVLRVYAATSGIVPVDDIYLTVSATRNGASLPGSPLTFGPWAVFNASTRGSFENNFTVKLPAAWLSGHIDLIVALDSTNVVSEANESNNVASMVAQFNAVPPLNLTIVPINYTHIPTGKVFPAPTRDQVSVAVLQMYPLSSVNVSIRTPVNFTGDLSVDGEWNRLLNLVTDTKRADGASDSQEYFGLLPTRNPAGDRYPRYWDGKGWLGLRVAIGVGYADTVAHEIGHNFGLPHAPCGNPGYLDPNYPYPNASIGQYGFDVAHYRIWSPVSPDNAKDVMSYCAPKWFSDYNYKKLYNDQRAHGAMAAAAAPIESLLIRATLDENDQIEFKPIYALPGVLTDKSISSDYTVEMIDALGKVVAAYPVRVYEADEGDFVARAISAIVPLPTQSIARVRLVRSNQPVAERSITTRSNVSSQPNVEQAAGTLTIRWNTPDTPALIRYTIDGGQSWTTLGIDAMGGMLSIDPKSLPKGSGYFEVIPADTLATP
jgi:hypothetical protein